MQAELNGAGFAQASATWGGTRCMASRVHVRRTICALISGERECLLKLVLCGHLGL